MNRTARSGFIALFAAASVALAGCASMEDMATNPEKEKTRKGAGYGAAAGAVVGAGERGTVGLRAGQDVVHVGLVAAAVDDGAVDLRADAHERREHVFAPIRPELDASLDDVKL